MPRKRLDEERERVGVYITKSLLTRFHSLYENYGDFTTVMNQILEEHLDRMQKKHCMHEGWSYDKDGRRCRKCGETVVDFGD